MGRFVLVLLLVTGPAAATAEEPRVAYWLHCAGCHRLDGTGAPPEVPTLIGEPGRIAALSGGREYLVRIPGVALAGVGDAELADVLNFVLGTFSAETVPAGFEPFAPAEVGRLRKHVLQDPLKRRAEITAAGRNGRNPVPGPAR